MMHTMTRHVWGLSILLFIFTACRQTPQAPEIPANYTTWNTPTEVVFNYSIPGHESHFRKIYIKSLGEAVRMTQSGNRTICDFPQGTIIVKEIYEGLDLPGEQEVPTLLTVMIKHSEHPESRGGWLWLSQNYATKEMQIIDYEYCVDCHTNANERHPYGDGNVNEEFRDYVYFPPIPPSSEPQPNSTDAAPPDSSIY